MFRRSTIIPLANWVTRCLKNSCLYERQGQRRCAVESTTAGFLIFGEFKLSTEISILSEEEIGLIAGSAQIDPPAQPSTLSTQGLEVPEIDNNPPG